MLTAAAQGVFPVAVTPFLPDGRLDAPSLDRVTDFYLARGATGLTILGVMGEAGKLSAEEAMQVVRAVTARAPVPVVVGVTAPGFAAMAALAQAAMAAGAAGVMVAPGGGLKGDAGIVDHYRTVQDMLPGVPVVVQDFPLVTGVHMPVAVILQIAKACPDVVMLKHEDWPGLAKITALRAAEGTGARRLSILCGNGGQFLPEELSRGADGAMTGFAFPEVLADMVKAHRAGDADRVRDLFDACLPLLRMEAQPGLGLSVRKFVLWRRGAIAHAALRRPGGTLDPASAAEVEVLMQRQARRLADLGIDTAA